MAYTTFDTHLCQLHVDTNTLYFEFCKIPKEVSIGDFRRNEMFHLQSKVGSALTPICGNLHTQMLAFKIEQLVIQTAKEMLENGELTTYSLFEKLDLAPLNRKKRKW